MLTLAKTLKQKGIKSLSASGKEIRLQCPQCRSNGDKSDDFKLYFNEQKKVGHCKRCDWSGGWKRLLKLFKIKNFKSSTPSLEELKKELNGETSGETQSVDDSLESILPRQVLAAWDNRRARSYLRKRGYSRRKTERYGFLYCVGGYFQNRLILPIFDHRGRYRTFAARYLPYFIIERYLRKCGRSGPKKYLYPKNCHTSRLLYGIDTYKKKKRRGFIILVEGIHDANHCDPFGCAVFGAHVSDTQIKIIRNAGIKNVVLCFDHDAKAIARKNIRLITLRSAARLRKFFNVGIIWLPNRPSDPTDYPRKLLFKWAQRSLVK